jgi:hypothetical protein
MKLKRLVLQTGVFFETQVKQRARNVYNKARYELFEQPDIKKRNRSIVLVFTVIFFLDYLMYCLHTNSSVFEIFPTFPTLEQQREIAVYLPALDGSGVFREKRSIPVYDDDEKTAKELFSIVVRGSRYENTSLIVPADLFVKKVWLYGGKTDKGMTCVFDLEPVELNDNVHVILNSESLFKEALEKTIKINLPSVSNVLLLERGIPVARLWES